MTEKEQAAREAELARREAALAAREAQLEQEQAKLEAARAEAPELSLIHIYADGGNCKGRFRQL